MLSLAKILIDSLNEESLRKLIPCEKQEEFKDKRGIALLESVLHLNDLEGADAHVDFYETSEPSLKWKRASERTNLT